MVKILSTKEKCVLKSMFPAQSSLPVSFYSCDYYGQFVSALPVSLCMRKIHIQSLSLFFVFCFFFNRLSCGTQQCSLELFPLNISVIVPYQHINIYLFPFIGYILFSSVCYNLSYQSCRQWYLLFSGLYWSEGQMYADLQFHKTFKFTIICSH